MLFDSHRFFSDWKRYLSDAKEEGEEEIKLYPSERFNFSSLRVQIRFLFAKAFRLILFFYMKWLALCVGSFFIQFSSFLFP